MIVAWEKFTKEEAVLKGLNPNLLEDEELWADHIVELNPENNTIVWEWHVWDHLIQDYSVVRPGFGVVSENPEKINLNYFGSNDQKDWNHINSIDYNQELDQILLSVHSFSEIWVIDHSINTLEAKSDQGDLLYRWGNPEAMNALGERDLFFQHDTTWIDNDTILLFNNGDRRLQPYSRVLELQYQTDNISGYITFPVILWEYESKNDFFAMNISGAQRLDDGNMLICDGPAGHVFEMTNGKEIVWEYTNPFIVETPNREMNEIFRAEKYYADYSGIVSLMN